MLRIISGTRKGARIAEVDRKNTRPTTDKNKEMLFNILGQYFTGGVCVDLFAGSGSLGFEALSRGFSQCYFVDDSREAIRTITENRDKLKFREGEDCIIIHADWRAFIKQAHHTLYSLILADPPYAFTEHECLLRKIVEANILTDGALVVLETGSNTVVTAVLRNLRLLRTRTAGSTKYHLYEFVPDRSPKEE